MKKYLFSLALAALTGACLPTATAAPVTFWFSGVVDSISNPSNTLPSGIAIGTPFSGRVSYDPALVSYSYSNSYATGDTSNNYFTNTDGLSMLVQIGGHTIMNAPNAEGYNCGYIGVNDDYDNFDEFNLDTESGDIIVDGQSTRVGSAIPVLSLFLRDQTKTTYNSVALPTIPPTANQFLNQRNLSWMNRLDDGINTGVYTVNGKITVLTTNELVTLNLHRTGGNTVQLGWRSALAGYKLQATTNLASASWQTVTNAVTDLNMEHTVTVTRVRFKLLLPAFIAVTNSFSIS